MLIIIVCGLIVREIGWIPAFISFALLFVLAIVQGLMAVKLRKVRSEMTKYTDRRMSLINEVLHGIRVIKAYAWEPAAAKSVQNARGKELKQLTWLLSFIAINYCVMFITPVVVGLVAFVVYASYGNVLTVSVVFTTFATINLLRLPIKIVPMAAMRAVDSLVAMKRLGRILELDETPERQTYDLQDSTLGSIHLKNVFFSWNKRMSTDTDTNTKTAADPVDVAINTTDGGQSTCDLINLSLTIKPGELVCVVGRVASGKTSLISALLGEMEQSKGEIEVKANQIAYVAQTAWIQSTTLKDNILFGAEMNEKRYNKAIEASQLKSDIQMMIGGDMCEIGDRGITLSGGQMQRLAIARALYLKGTEMFLLDDVLSAVDVHVADALFQQCVS